LTFSTTESVQIEVGETVQLAVGGLAAAAAAAGASALLPELENFTVELKKDSQ